MVFGKIPLPLWVNAEVLSHEEIKLLYEKGIEISAFSHLINFDDINKVAEAIDTIKQHHPSHKIWVENPADF
ncbi:MAG: hypothetical protein H7Z73_02695 [Candidatus Saccharibacteria bacterium]|nr:hypothetical protein [Moraxellaceae bacterium]